MRLLLLTLVVLAATSTLEAKRRGRRRRPDPFLAGLGEALDMLHEKFADMAAEQGMECPNLDGLGEHLQEEICFGEELTDKYNEAAEACPGYIEALLEMKKEEMEGMAEAGRRGGSREPSKEQLLAKFLEDQKCFYECLGWIDGEGQIQMETVTKDIEGTVIAERLRSVPGMCHMMAMSITEECLQGEDEDDGEDAVARKGSKSSESDESSSGSKSSRSKSSSESGSKSSSESGSKSSGSKSSSESGSKSSGSKSSGSKSSSESSESESTEEEATATEPQSADLMERILDAVRLNAFFTCMYVELQMGCGETVHAAMDHLDIEEFLSGWEQSEAAGPNLVAAYGDGEEKGEGEACTPAPLFIYSADFNGLFFDIRPGQTVSTQNILAPPEAFWLADPKALYTYIIEDNSVVTAGGEASRYLHYVRINVEGHDLTTGQVAVAYIPPYYFEVNEEGNDLVDDDLEGAHEFLHAVFRQAGELSLEGEGAFPTQTVCDQGVVDGRIGLFSEDLAAEFDLTLVAASYVRVPYGGFLTKSIMCESNVCLEEPFPFAGLEGVTVNGVCEGQLLFLEPFLSAPAGTTMDG